MEQRAIWYCTEIECKQSFLILKFRESETTFLYLEGYEDFFGKHLYTCLMDDIVWAFCR